MKRLQRQRGVTYLEFTGIFVIFIVASAVLLLEFQHVRENDPRITCASNLKILGVAYIQYMDDADEKMPPGVDSLNRGWAGQLYHYVKSTGTYQCPQDKHDDPHFISYAHNQRLAGQSLAILSNPSATVELFELTTLNCDPSAHECNSATGLTAPQVDSRHDPKSFTLYFLASDGHVKYLRPAQVSSGFYAVKPELSEAKGYIMTFAAK